MAELEDRVAIITGAASGIGREHALCFAREGAAVVVADVDDPSAMVAEIAAGGGRAIAHQGDCADWATAHALIDAAVEAFGRLDCLVNNAGGGAQALAADVTEAAWDREMRINLKAMFSPTHAALGWWTDQRDRGRPVAASIVNTTSGAGLLGNAGQSAYGAAKAGVAAFTLIAAAELAGSGIRVNAIAPAARTPATEAAGEVLTRLMRAPADDRLFDRWHPGNISPLVAYLSSADCPVSGQVFLVSGGVIGHFSGWTVGETAHTDRVLTIPELRERIPEMLALAPDRSQAGGAAYAALRQAWHDEQLAGPEHSGTAS
jgi:NAD(P)-dependent dehydrogenase (short-subunit alcohol dehydrogenase family)